MCRCGAKIGRYWRYCVGKAENEVKAKLLEYLELRGCMAWRTNAGMRGGVRMGKAGLPDIIGLMPGGRFVGVEVKTESGEVSYEQLHFLGDVAKLGGLAFVARSIKDIDDHLTRYAKKTPNLDVLCAQLREAVERDDQRDSWASTFEVWKKIIKEAFGLKEGT